jgi:prepilin-type N-terminal cleavage/methylation domain-containing protein
MARSPRPRPAAFTLIELLVVIAIIGVLIGLILPAVQRARMSAARNSSSNNLHQIALATHQYEGAYKLLPDNVSNIDGSSAYASMSSVFAKILPYVEQQLLYQQGLSKGLSGLQSTVPLYTSPADGSTTDMVGMTSYVSNDFVFGNYGVSLAASFKDGQVNTILFTERPMLCSGKYNAWAILVDGTTINVHPTTVAARLKAKTVPLFAPGGPSCDPSRAVSPDTTGILAAMADGSVRFVAPGSAGAVTTTPGAPTLNWEAALTPDGGEVFNGDW